MIFPLMVYMFSFKLHFLILSNSGPGDAQMSSLFQANLRGNDFYKNPLEAAYGSKVTFKNMGYGGGLLHSHVQTYPVGSEQQQVTCYHYRDENNEFIISPLWEEPPLPSVNDTSAPIRMLKNNDIIRLVHNSTKRNIHSHIVAAPITKENYEISGYGDEKLGDTNDYWVVEIVDDIMRGKARPDMSVNALTTRLRLRHKNLNCYMYAANAVLPQWGWKQIEVSCIKELNPKDEHAIWNIESHWNDRRECPVVILSYASLTDMCPFSSIVPTGDAKLYRSPFFRDFVHLNVAMMTSNNALVPDADKEDILASKPLEWPWLWNGLRMNSWADESYKYYLIGNPVVWWGSSASLFLFVNVLGYYLARLQRRHADLSPQDFNQFVFVGKVAFLGWFLHYLPFLLMGRVTYIHHYLPTLYFAVIIFVHLLDHFFFNPSTARYRARRIADVVPAAASSDKGGSYTSIGGGRAPLSTATKNAFFALFAGAVVGTFLWFWGVSFGMRGPMQKWWGLKWRQSWNIY